jgi:SAM-dependent methyltransferase
MEMTEQGYNLELEKPFRMFENLIAVSGRCAHNLFDGRGYGKLGEAVEETLEALSEIVRAGKVRWIGFSEWGPEQIEAAFAIPGADVGAADLLALSFRDDSILSLSCMHVIEHVGLGRYGDTLDPMGDARAAAELKRVLAPGGHLLFVTPVGRPEIHFNAHRIYSFEAVMALFEGLELAEFALITDKRDGAALVMDADPARVAKQRYGCGCFLFRKPA